MIKRLGWPVACNCSSTSHWSLGGSPSLPFHHCWLCLCPPRTLPTLIESIHPRLLSSSAVSFHTSHLSRDLAPSSHLDPASGSNYCPPSSSSAQAELNETQKLKPLMALQQSEHLEHSRGTCLETNLEPRIDKWTDDMEQQEGILSTGWPSWIRGRLLCLHCPPGPSAGAPV